MQEQQTQIDLTNTTGITNSEGKNLFQSGIILRKISKFVAGTENDGIMPISVFFDPTNGKILKEGIPLELREELKDELC